MNLTDKQVQYGAWFTGLMTLDTRVVIVIGQGRRCIHYHRYKWSHWHGEGWPIHCSFLGYAIEESRSRTNFFSRSGNMSSTTSPKISSSHTNTRHEIIYVRTHKPTPPLHTCTVMITLTQRKPFKPCLLRQIQSAWHASNVQHKTKNKSAPNKKKNGCQ